MFLLFTSSLLSLISSHTNVFGSMFTRWVNQKRNRRQMELLHQKGNYLNEQAQINMSDRFAQYSKIQRKINAIDEELSQLNREKRDKILTITLVINYGVKIVLALLLTFMSLYYRRTPVFSLPEKFDLTPFSVIISYPNEPNGVSFHFWVLCCSIVFKMKTLFVL